MVGSQSGKPPLSLWGGVECTVNRVGNRYYDQLDLSGHRKRLSDLDAFAALGLKTLRYPILWETTAPEGVNQADWRWADERLARLDSLGFTPIVGLTHHGSGPISTSLVAPEYAEGLAAYAGAVARRYPNLAWWTPVNEPLTTARFSGLYGHWYPHGRDALTFARALLNQCRATVLAMRAIRAVNPAARLIQTEDIGKTWSTPTLAYQAEFENERRWLSYDLLCGRVVPGHPMHHYLCWLGIPGPEIDWFAANPCPPDVLGINHYLTSERFLDERTERYPIHTHGGNGRHRYADIEAVRVCHEGLAGPGALLLEAWDRYGLPLAVTEAHLGSTPDEQIRWLGEVWDDAQAARREGADVLAVTAWSLLGAYDWNSLLTRWDGCYEPGVFAVRNGQIHETPLTPYVKALAYGEGSDHPARRQGSGWWHQPMRLLYPPVRTKPRSGRESSGNGANLLARDCIARRRKWERQRGMSEASPQRPIPRSNKRL